MGLINEENINTWKNAFTIPTNFHIVNSNVLLIHFEEFFIENELEQRHKIKDLYVKIILSNDFEILGLRGSVTLREYATRYSHSHLPSETTYNNTWGNFCTGEEFGTLINNYKSKRTLEALNLIMFTLEDFITSESLNGGPHIPMDRLYLENSLLGNFNLEFKSIKNINDLLKYTTFTDNCDLYTEWTAKNLNLEIEGSENFKFVPELNTFVVDLEKAKNIFEGRFVTGDDHIKTPDLFRLKGEITKLKIIEEDTYTQSNELFAIPLKRASIVSKVKKSIKNFMLTTLEQHINKIKEEKWEKLEILLEQGEN